MRIEAGSAEVNGTRLYYEVAGEGIPVLFIHGNIGDRRHWDDQFLVFAQKHRVIRYDVRGFGKSDLPIEGHLYSHQRDTAALLQHFGIQNAHIIGLSMGAGIAADFVLAHPEMSRSLVSVGPWVVGYDSATRQLVEAFKSIATALEQDGTAAAVEQFIAVLGDSICQPRVAERLRQLGADYSFWHLCHSDPGETQVSSETVQTRLLAAQRLGEVRVPVLIITAEHDVPACIEIADLMERRIAGAQKIVMPGTGHIINMEQPVEFNRRVMHFLEQVDSGSKG